jgi:hypothetical protein
MTDSLLKAPPENISKRPNKVPCWALKKSANAAESIPGVGM